MDFSSITNSASQTSSSGLTAASGLQGASSQELSQADFIELLVAQVKNQDPSEPMDPSQFMDQLAQFSTVNGVTELNNSFNGLADKLSSGQSIQAAGLVGRSALIPGGEGLLAEGNMAGQLELPHSASEVTLNIFNTRGEQVRSLQLGGHGEGSLQFQWDGFDDSGNPAPSGHYVVEAGALMGGNTEAVAVSIKTQIDSVTLNQEATGTPEATILNLASGASVPLSSVQQFN